MLHKKTLTASSGVKEEDQSEGLLHAHNKRLQKNRCLENEALSPLSPCKWATLAVTLGQGMDLISVVMLISVK